MAQTAALKYQDDGDTIDYTPASAVIAGQVVLIGSVPFIAPSAIAANALGSLTRSGLWKVPKATGAIAVGNDVYWSATGTPVTGDSASGAASITSTGYYMGRAALAALSGDSYVHVMLGAGALPLTGSSLQMFKMGTVSAETDAANAIAAADMINGIVVHTVSTGRTLTTPTGAQILAACPAGIVAGDCFRLSVITVGTGADDISTLTAGDADVTFVGNVTVGPDASTFNGYGTWIFKYTGSNAFVGYRVG